MAPMEPIYPFVIVKDRCESHDQTQVYARLALSIEQTEFGMATPYQMWNDVDICLEE